MSEDKIIEKEDDKVSKIKGCYMDMVESGEHVPNDCSEGYEGNYKLPVDYTKLEWRQRSEVREQYIKGQRGLCMFCDAPLEKQPPTKITKKEINWKGFPPNFLKYPIHLQHCHKTGMTEGAVHAYCNAVMWQYHGR